jgi:glucoamylase
VGRYPGDIYDGGNPWQLLTAVLAKTFYQGATAFIKSNGFSNEDDRKSWFDLLKIPEGASLQDQVSAAISAGDSVLYRLYLHVKGDGGHIDEQMDRNNGTQRAAHDLTWSLANVLSAMQERTKATQNF